MPDTVEVYALDLDRADLDLNRLWGLLDLSETERAQQFRSDTNRRRFIVRRAQLRELLSRYIGEAPQDLRFTSNSFGKPFLNSGDLQFNLSHSAGICIIAISQGRQVGCDIEWRNPTFPSDDIAQAFFSAREARSLRELHASQQVVAFFNCWTRKEAYIKARGYGVSLPLDSFEVSLAPAEPAVLLGGCDGWSVQSFEPVVGFQAAVVAAGTDWRLSLRESELQNPIVNEPTVFMRKKPDLPLQTEPG